MTPANQRIDGIFESTVSPIATETQEVLAVRSKVAELVELLRLLGGVDSALELTAREAVLKCLKA